MGLIFNMIVWIGSILLQLFFYLALAVTDLLANIFGGVFLKASESMHNKKNTKKKSDTDTDSASNSSVKESLEEDVQSTKIKGKKIKKAGIAGFIASWYIMSVTWRELVDLIDDHCFSFQNLFNRLHWDDYLFAPFKETFSSVFWSNCILVIALFSILLMLIALLSEVIRCAKIKNRQNTT